MNNFRPFDATSDSPCRWSSFSKGTGVCPTGRRETGQAWDKPVPQARTTVWVHTAGFALGFLLLCGSGCSSFTGGKLGRDDLSLMPSGNLAGGQRAFNQSELGEEYYAERRDTSIKAKDLAPDKWSSTIKKLVGQGPNKEVASKALAEGRQQYSEAVALRRKSSDAEAISEAFLKPIEKLQIAAERWPDSSIEEDALYLLGECHFFADHYWDANLQFEKLISIYPSTQYLDRVQNYRFQVARYWLDIAEKQSTLSSPLNLTDEKLPMKDIAGEGRDVLNRMRLDDPTGKLADDATFMLGKAFYDQDRFFEAAETFADLRNNYPASEHQFNAHLMEFESRLAMYDGSEYDGRSLKQAEEILRQLLKRFPEQSAELRDELTQQAGQVRNMLAERDMDLAEYYAKRGENRAARIYLQTLIQDYPETEMAMKASRRLSDLEGKPEEPVQHVQWLVDMFPEPKSTRPLIRSGSLK